jgi:hypothetical protein
MTITPLSRFDPLLTNSSDCVCVNGIRTMASESIKLVRGQLGERIADIQRTAARLSPLDVYRRMDEIREMAALNGMAALERLAQCSAQMALLPGHRVATASCLEHFGEALDSESPADCQTILAALAVRLH